MKVEYSSTFISDRISVPSEEGKSVTLKPSKNAKDLSRSAIHWFKYIEVGVFVDIAKSEGMMMSFILEIIVRVPVRAREQVKLN